MIAIRNADPDSATEWLALPFFFRFNDTRLSFTHFCHFVAQTWPIVEIAKWHFCQARLSEEEYEHILVLSLNSVILTMDVLLFYYVFKYSLH